MERAIKDDLARQLAHWHSTSEQSITMIVRLKSDNEDEDSEPIKLLEVNTETVPSDIVPVMFGPSTDVPCPSLVVEVTPEEYEKIQKHELTLPDDWRLGDVLYKGNGDD